ncbi:MAG: hypothetical protein ACK47B_20255 [Armatimonadota bacterium]
MIYKSFVDWVEAEVLSAREAHPEWKRLDGRDSGGNPATVARFEALGQAWEVHGDTHFDPVLRAYAAIRSREVEEPFVMEATRSRACLNLSPALRGQGRRKYFYVYRRATARR